MELILWTLGILALLYVVICVFYYLIQERLIFVRVRLRQNYRFKFKGQFEELWFDRSDGARIHGVLFSAQGQTKGVILYFHGNSGSLRRWGKQARKLTNYGYDVLVMDYRGYGKSRGKLSERAVHEDARCAYDHLLKSHAPKNIVIYGRSLGSGPATRLAASVTAKVLILETPFANLYDVARHYSALLPYRLLLRYPFRNDLYISGVSCPIYIFHGKKDMVVPYNSALKLYSLIPPELVREMITFKKGRHSNLYKYNLFDLKLREILNGESS